ncbi:MAG: hypothetical protein VX223_07585 [Myxococcota bacterium]|nr:hypothetical protein [Myxococcota bacterium]
MQTWEWMKSRIQMLLLSTCLLISACTPEVVNNYTLSADPGSGDIGSTDNSDDQDVSNGEPPICDEGYVVNSTGDGCAPICAAGYEPNENEDGCIRIPQEATATICPAGYIPAGGGFGGLCAKIVPVTLHGFVTTRGAGDAISGAKVTLYPASGGTITTGSDGYFEVEVSTHGDVTVQYEADGHFESKRVVNIPLVGGDDGDRLYVDGSIDLLRDPGGGTFQPPSDGSLYVAGTIYAGSQPAAGATVRLFNHTLGYDVDSVVTNSDGSFAITNIADAGYAFAVRIDPYDADQNGVYDYQYAEVDLGVLSTSDVPGDSNTNVSNLVVVLTTVAKNIAYVSFDPPLTSIGAGALVTNAELAQPNDDIIIHFGSQVDEGSVDIKLFEYFDGFYGNIIPASYTWNASSTALTINPSGPLTADTDPGTQYEIRISTLLWSDGSPYIALGTPLNQTTRIRFDLTESEAIPVSAEPEFDVDTISNDYQTVTQVQCDSRVCWLLDANQYPYSGPADPASSSSDNTFFNAASGVDIRWLPTPGASSYRIYARQTGPQFDDTTLLGWHQLGSTITPAFADTAGAVAITASQLLSSSNPFPNWNDFGPGALDGPVSNPMSFGNTIEIAVTSINAKGLESLIDPQKVLTLADESQARIVEVSMFSSGGEDFTSETELGFGSVQKEWRMRFSELMDTQSTLSWSVDSATISSISQPTLTSWDNGDTSGAAAPNDVMVEAGMTVNFQGSCTEVTADSASDQNTVTVRHTAFFNTGTVLFLNSSASGLRFSNVMTLSGVNSTDNTLTFVETFADVGGDSGVTVGDFVCIAEAQQGLIASVTQAASSADQLNVNEPGLFYPNQDIIVFDADAMSASSYTVRRLRAPVLQNGLEILPGLLGFDSTLTNSSNSIVFPRPSSSEIGFRSARRLDLAQNTTVNGAVQLEIGSSSMLSSTILEGDLLMIDVDGQLNTLSDQYFVRAGTINVWPDDGAGNPLYRVQLEPGPGQTNVLVNGLELDTSTTVIIHLADSFQVTGGTDTSGNNGIEQNFNQFSFCDSSVPNCNQGTLTY